VPVYVGEADAAEARGEVNKATSGARPQADLALVRFLAFGLGHGGLRATPIREVVPISAASTLDAPGAPTAIPLPGHPPGSLAYHLRGLDAIFVGDAMTTRSVTTGIAGPALGPFMVDPVRAPASLEALDGLAARWVLPGHGDRWTGGLSEALGIIRSRRQD
jgi:glyoxylase-like metal-dependent hydrolase (beta-lactamase superfamily II)